MQSGDSDNVKPGDVWMAALREHFHSLHPDYTTFAKALTEISHIFRQELAAAIQPRLNAHLEKLPQQSYEEKQSLASWANHELRQLGLTIRCPRTGNPAIIVADFKDREHESESRFRLESRDERGRKTRSSTGPKMPELELMEDPPRREPLARRWNKPPDRDEPQR